MVLQRLCYYAWMVAKALDDRELFDEAPCAWPHGPVFVQLHQALGGSSTSLVTPATFTKQGLEIRPLPDQDQRLAAQVYSLWGERSGLNLNALTTKELPWLEAKARSGPGEAASLDVELAGRFFRAYQDSPQTAVDYANRFASEYTAPGHVKKPEIHQ